MARTHAREHTGSVRVAYLAVQPPLLGIPGARQGRRGALPPRRRAGISPYPRDCSGWGKCNRLAHATAWPCLNALLHLVYRFGRGIHRFSAQRLAGSYWAGWRVHTYSYPYPSSQLIRLNWTSDPTGSHLTELDRWPSLGPIVDFVVVDLECARSTRNAVLLPSLFSLYQLVLL